MIIGDATRRFRRWEGDGEQWVGCARLVGHSAVQLRLGGDKIIRPPPPELLHCTSPRLLRDQEFIYLIHGNRVKAVLFDNFGIQIEVY